MTDAFGILFHADIIDDYIGINDINALNIILFCFAPYYRTGTRTATG
jgi:hypothetical protein